MQKVKVTRYVSGQRPLYAGETSSESEGEEEILVKPSEEEERIATTVLESDIVSMEYAPSVFPMYVVSLQKGIRTYMDRGLFSGSTK